MNDLDELSKGIEKLAKALDRRERRRKSKALYTKRLKLAGIVRKSYRVPEEYEAFFREQARILKDKHRDQVNERYERIRKLKGLI